MGDEKGLDKGLNIFYNRLKNVKRSKMFSSLQQIIPFWTAHPSIKGYPFLAMWVKNKLAELVEGAYEPIQNDDLQPISVYKSSLALANAFVKFKLRDFAEAHGVSYGVVRVWNRQPHVRKATRYYRKEFANIYLKELNKLYREPPSEERELHLTEFSNYDPRLRAVIIEVLLNEFNSATADRKFQLSVIFYHLVRSADTRDIFHLPPGAKEKEDFKEAIKNDLELNRLSIEYLFLNLHKAIENNELVKALEIVDSLKFSMTQLLEKYASLKIAFIDKGRSKKGSPRRYPHSAIRES